MASSTRLKRFTSGNNDQNPPGALTSNFNQASGSSTESRRSVSIALDSSRSPAGCPMPTAPAYGSLKRGLHSGWGGVQKLLEALDSSGITPSPLKEIVSGITDLIEERERASEVSEEYEALREELEGLIEDLHGYLSGPIPQTVTGSMKNLYNTIGDELEAINHKSAKRQKGSDGRGQTLKIDDLDKVLASYRRIRGCVQRITLNANLSVWSIVDGQAKHALLDRMGPTLAAIFNSDESANLKRGPCTDGTRINVLAQMHRWVYASPAGALYWLNGMAGTGKTTISYSLCSELENAHRLGASFFCSRLLPECRDVKRIIPSIAYQLALFSRPFCCALLRVLEEGRDVHKRLIKIQFESLIVKPLIEVQRALPTDLVVVVDALDECDDEESTRQILDLILSKAWTLPIKFFVSSRPEPQIRDEMMRQGGLRASASLVLHELQERDVKDDIKMYLRDALRGISPSEWQLDQLVDHAGVLFIYAATAVRYVGYDNFQRDPVARLETILGASNADGANPNRYIDDLYEMILKAALEDQRMEPREREETRMILNTVVCAREPLTTGALWKLLKLEHIGRVHLALRPLWSVLHVIEASQLVTTLHASFPDYILDPKRSRGYHCSILAHNQLLAKLSLDLIAKADPQFNICGLESSYVLDKQVPGLNERIQRAIPTELYYSCRYWAAHLSQSPGSPDLIGQLEGFCRRNFFLWIEVLNLKKKIHTGVDIMWQAEDWGVRQDCSEHVIQLVHDAWRFVMAVASSPVSQSTPHLYVSALSFWPASTPIFRNYVKSSMGIIRPVGPAMETRQRSILATWSFDSPIQSAAFSPDAIHVALAVANSLLLVDALTGQILLLAFEGHSKNITSVDFSPDGRWIASGSDDKTIRIWERQNGKLVIGPLQGHSRKVTSVKFSPDGTCLASGSQDNSVRLWGPLNAQIKVEVFRGHTSYVTSVGFSPSGTRLVSASSDSTVRMWDIKTAKGIGEFRGHSKRVTSAEFSADGTRIVSSSYDKTIRLWDVNTRAQVVKEFQGHTDRVTAAAFSPSSKLIASGSEDKSVRVWDVENGETILGPLEMHSQPINSVVFSKSGSYLLSTSDDGRVVLWDARQTQNRLDTKPQGNLAHGREITSGSTGPSVLHGHKGSVSSVSFSPDGARLASGSSDNKLRVWEVCSGRALLGPLPGHAGTIYAVAFSPDGTRIISGSVDSTVRVWDSTNGRTMVGPLRGHSDAVYTVAFSPDGTRIISGSNDNTIRIWDLKSGSAVALSGHTDAIYSVEFLPNHRILSGSVDDTIRGWSSENGDVVLGPLKGHTSKVQCVAFSHDGIRVASGSGDNTISVCDLRSGERTLTLGPHQGPVRAIAFSPDGKRLTSGCWDGDIRVWDLQSGQTVMGPYKGHTEGICSIAFSPTARHVASGSFDSTIIIWDVQNISSRTSVQSMDSSRSRSPAPASRVHEPWIIREDGWVVDQQSRFLVCIPSDLRKDALPCNALLRMGRQGYVRLDFDDVFLGSSWTQCYRPE